jgi:tetraacyldisaccharide 4'-kinase
MPVYLTEQQMTNSYEQIAPLNWQPLFFSAITYQPLQDMEGQPVNFTIDDDTSVFLLTGIANPKPLDASHQPINRKHHPP